MTAVQILTTMMMLFSMMLFVALLVAWAEFGRTRHALSWAAAYGLATLEWCMLSLVFSGYHHSVMLAIAAGSIVGGNLLVFSGFRLRARRALRPRMLIAISGLSTLVAFGLCEIGLDQVALALPLLGRVVLMPLAAYYVIGRADRSRAERLAAATLVAWAGVSLGLAMCCMAPANWSEIGPQLLGAVALPTAYLAVGLGTVVLLASDLAGDLRRLAVKDPLTNVLNRRGFDEQAANVIASEARRGESVCLVLADIDHFKQLNDRHGHLAGDRALVKVASCLAAEIRRGDVIGRIGGEEFAILLAPCKGTVARRIVERMRRSIEALDVGLPQGHALTTSFGVVELERSASFDKALRKADEALYASKQAGRNRVTLAA